MTFGSLLQDWLFIASALSQAFLVRAFYCKLFIAREGEWVNKF
jgi:hypothetical protein